MAVDLSDYVENLKREVSAPGLTQLPNATDAEYLGNLQDGFWESVLDGVITGFTESDGIVTNKSAGGADIGRDLVQLVVFYAGFRIVRNQLRDLKTSFKAKAGTVDYEIEQSANVLKAIMDDLTKRRSIVLARLGDIGSTHSYYFDQIQGRENSIIYGDSYWISQDNGYKY